MGDDSEKPVAYAAWTLTKPEKSICADRTGGISNHFWSSTFSSVSVWSPIYTSNRLPPLQDFHRQTRYPYILPECRDGPLY